MAARSNSAVAAAARGLRPGLPVLFVSGFTGDEPGGAIPDGGLLLQKPFTLQALSEKLREAVDAPAGLEPATKPL